MQWHLLWFVLAGFVLGFSASTLWEWLYYRRLRAARQEVTPVELVAEPAEEDKADDVDDVLTAAMSWEAGYQGPGVYMETEQAEPFPEEAEQGAVLEEDLELVHQSQDEANSVTEPPPEPFQPESQSTVEALEEEVDAGPPADTGSVTGFSLSDEQLKKLAALTTVPGDREAVPAAAGLPGDSATRTVGYPDDLTRVKGIGRVYARRLHEAGIFTWHQLSQTDVDTLIEIAEPPVSANVAEWPERARELAERHKRVGAAYVGPVPDDLTRIKGLGAVAVQALYRAGIVTYAQLASVSDEALADVVPTSPTGERIDYLRWHMEASKLVESGQ
jgi:predicted flap endonuclease-1-like 5' DNA nuclease